MIHCEDNIVLMVLTSGAEMYTQNLSQACHPLCVHHPLFYTTHTSACITLSQLLEYNYFSTLLMTNSHL